MKIFIETDRLLLREIVEEDVHDFFELDSDPRVHRYLGKQPVQTLEQSREMIRHVRQQYLDNGIGRWAVILKDSGSLAGWSGLKYELAPINDQNGYYDLGYRFKPAFWGQGIATETARVSLRYGFEQLQLEKICAAAEVANIASNIVLRKVGLQFVESFTYEGEACHWYELERNSWQSTQSKRPTT